ncbi:MAG TPA: Rieske 2Fe-2S domain-containing protein [Streptosporangiaceae bacterium]|nr:Rieske 2Fe-2S domain-containing protein [Streptosporangiaceae bacterium]
MSDDKAPAAGPGGPADDAPGGPEGGAELTPHSGAGPDAGSTPQQPGPEAEVPEAQRARPRKVIGTPPPAAARTLLGEAEGIAPRGGRTLLDPAVSGQPARAEAVPPAVAAEREARAKRTERLVAYLFLLSALASIGFIAAYIGMPVRGIGRALHSNLALGSAMTVAFLSVAAGAVIWVRRLMPDVEEVEQRKPLASSPAERQAFEETFIEGAEQSGFVKRPLIRRTLIAASVPLALAPIVLLRDMGPLPGTSLRYTVWRKGMRLLVFGSNRPIRPGDFDSAGGLITVVPDGYQDDLDALAKATAILIKFRPGQLHPPTVMDWTVQNIVCYSKICTHVGCPAALYEQTTHRILCPCHQSTFDATRGAQVLFGPAPRPLPQLPLAVDAEGYLVANGDFNEPVGPSFWERG